MNVTRTVDAIFPILINDSQEKPFAIIELYQPTNDEADTDVKSSVAVICCEHALRMHPAIHPGQSITLIGIVSCKWNVPDKFQKNLNSHEVPAPGRVLHPSQKVKLNLTKINVATVLLLLILLQCINITELFFS
jgi:hypothetical protein